VGLCAAILHLLRYKSKLQINIPDSPCCPHSATGNKIPRTFENAVAAPLTELSVFPGEDQIPPPTFFKGGVFLKQNDLGQPSERYKKPLDPVLKNRLQRCRTKGMLTAAGAPRCCPCTKALQGIRRSRAHDWPGSAAMGF